MSDEEQNAVKSNLMSNVTENDVKIDMSRGFQNENVTTSRREKCVWFWRKVLVFLFSQVGIVFLVILYSILGAFVFSALEEPHQKLVRLKVKELRNETKNRLWNTTQNTIIVFSEESKRIWSEKIEQDMIKFQEEVFKASQTSGWDGKNDNYTGPSDWSFTGAFLYSVTVITTIGYGHITPKTGWGRIVTLLYALIGIPLVMICLANLGKLMGDGFRLLYYTAQHSCQKKQTVHSKTRGSLRNSIKNNERAVESEVFLDQTYKTQKVPVIVCVSLVVLYILIGTIIFSIWEAWDPLTSAYFCFITLSTIGFGDVVPGHSFGTVENQVQPKQVMCALYLLLGMAFIAMCFDLMVDHVRNAARKFGQWIGLLRRK